MLEYKTKAALTKAVREIVNAQPFDIPFQSKLISDLIERYHYYCGPALLRPTYFRKLHNPGMVYLFEGYFPEPLCWHGVSWVKCINPPKEESEIAQAFRRMVANDVFSFQCSHPTCQRCDEAPSTETDHVFPEFADMVNTTLRTLPEGAAATLFASFDWKNAQRYSIPTSHPAHECFQELHGRAVLMAVCKPCHLLNAEDRKTQ